MGQLGARHRSTAMIKIDITESDVIDVVGKFLRQLFECTVIKGQVNRVSMPHGSFIVMMPIFRKALSMNVKTVKETSSDIMTPTELTMQLDFYGDNAGDMAQIFLNCIHDDFAFRFFPLGIKPLYTSDIRQLPFITGEKNYLDRWSTDLTLQFNPTVEVPEDTWTTLGDFRVIHANGL